MGRFHSNALLDSKLSSLETICNASGSTNKGAVIQGGLGALSRVFESDRFAIKGTVWERPFQKHILVERPRVLTNVRESWPNSASNVSENEVVQKKQARETPNTIHTLAASAKRENVLNVVSSMRFCSKTILLRTITWCFRFIRNCKSRSSHEGQQSLQLQVSEIENAERQLIQSVKTEAFSDEFSFLSGGKGDTDKKPPLLVSQLICFG